MRPWLPAVLLLILPACSDPVDPPFISGTPETDTAGSTGSTGTTSGLPTTTASETSLTDETTTTTGTTTDPVTSTSSSSGEPVTSTSSSSGGSSSSGEPGTDSSSSGDVDLCKDGAHNQDETDVDCGGALCQPCAAGAACVVDIDCDTAWCDALLCAVPDCLVDADCDGQDTDCIEASCDLVTRSCTLGPINDGLGCEDDGNLCTIGGLCDMGACVAELPKLCDGLDNFCGVGGCDPGTGVCIAVPFPENEGKPCDDGFVCTPNDTCVAGLCGVGGPGYLFFEDFSAPKPGWDFSAPWEIGPAELSKDGYNGADPMEDHSPGLDQQLAGALIGKLLPLGAQDKTCLTSPVIPAPGQGPMWLSFWRNLHTDYFPFVVNTVEAFDGKNWQELEVGYNDPGIGDATWTFVDYDLGAFTGPKLQVRICFSQTPAALEFAGWSLDDLTVGPYSCTPE